VSKYNYVTKSECLPDKGGQLLVKIAELEYLLLEKVEAVLREEQRILSTLNEANSSLLSQEKTLLELVVQAHLARRRKLNCEHCQERGGKSVKRKSVSDDPKLYHSQVKDLRAERNG